MGLKGLSRDVTRGVTRKLFLVCNPVSEIEEYGKTIPVGQIVFRPFFTQMTQCVFTWPSLDFLDRNSCLGDAGNDF